MTKKIFIEGMSCSHCVARVEKALDALDGVKSVNVDLDGKFAILDLDYDIDNKKLTEIIDEVGYDVIDIK